MTDIEPRYYATRVIAIAAEDIKAGESVVIDERGRARVNRAPRGPRATSFSFDEDHLFNAAEWTAFQSKMAEVMAEVHASPEWQRMVRDDGKSILNGMTGDSPETADRSVEGANPDRSLP